MNEKREKNWFDPLYTERSTTKTIQPEHKPVTFQDVMEAFKRNDSEQRIPVLKMEIDYELQVLADAICENNTLQIAISKAKLEELRKEALMLEII